MEKHNLFNSRIFRYLKSIIICCVILLSTLSLYGCDDSYVQGLEYCNTYVNDTVEIKYLLYDTEFLDKYTYKNGDFFYYGGTFTMCKSLLYLEYDEETYDNAKEELLLNTECSQLEFNYKGFTFFNNLSWRNEHRPYSENELETLSDCFVMLSYNDERNTIVAIGYCKKSSNDISGRDIKNDEDFAEFIEKYYLEFYKF